MVVAVGAGGVVSRVVLVLLLLCPSAPALVGDVVEVNDDEPTEGNICTDDNS